MKAVNLIPGDQRRGPAAAGSLGVYATFGVLALVLVGVTALVLTSNQLGARKHQLAEVTQRHATVAAQVSALQPYVEFTTLEQRRLETVRTLAASRFDWARALGGLSRVTTSQVALTTMLGTVAPGVTVGSGAGGSGGAAAAGAGDASSGGGASLRTALPNPAIELTGCGVSNQAVVAYTSRLRALRGVIRVSLSDTEKPDQAAGTAGAAAATSATPANGAATGCGPSPGIATFHAVVFFSPLPAAVAAGTDATASATAAPATTAAPAAATP